MLPLTALTTKDRRDLDLALELGADWIALSLVQRPEDIVEASEVEADPLYRQLIDASHAATQPGTASVADAVCCAMRRVVALLQCAAIVSYTRSGATSLRAARERPEAPVLSLTPDIQTARRLALAWGVHSVHIEDVADVTQMTEMACRVAWDQGFAAPGATIVVIAGVPFGSSGSTNLLRIASV